MTSRATASLRRRLDLLQDRSTEPDLVGQAISRLSDADLDTLYEHSLLRETGLDEEQISEMMGSRYDEVQEAATHFQKHYQALLEEETCTYGLR